MDVTVEFDKDGGEKLTAILPQRAPLSSKTRVLSTARARAARTKPENRSGKRPFESYAVEAQTEIPRTYGTGENSAFLGGHQPRPTAPKNVVGRGWCRAFPNLSARANLPDARGTSLNFIRRLAVQVPPQFGDETRFKAGRRARESRGVQRQQSFAGGVF